MVENSLRLKAEINGMILRDAETDRLTDRVTDILMHESSYLESEGDVG